MLTLFEYQTQLSRCLLIPDSRLPSDLNPEIARHRNALHIHRNTVFQALLTALGMTFPTVARLIGEAAFNEVARDYIRRFPPEGAVLYGYGQSFPEHLRLAAPEHNCLSDIARFDLLIDQAGHECVAQFGERIGISATTMLRLTKSLRCSRFGYAVDSIREDVTAGRTEISQVLLQSSQRNIAVWRTTAGVSVRSLSAPAFSFLEALVCGRGAEEAIVCAIEGCSVQQALEAIQGDVFASSLCRIITSSAPETVEHTWD